MARDSRYHRTGRDIFYRLGYRTLQEKIEINDELEVYRKLGLRNIGVFTFYLDGDYVTGKFVIPEARSVGEILAWANVLQNELIRVCDELEG